MGKPSRRQFLRQGGALAWLAIPGLPPGLDSESDRPETVLEVDLPQLIYPGRWNPRPGVMRELAQEARLRTRLEPLHEPTTVTAESPALFNTPFLYVAGEGGLPPLAPAAQERLARFLDLGGMLVFDAADGGTDRGFERDVAAFLATIAPGATLAPLAAEHVLYRSFYLVDAPVGRTAAAPQALAIEAEGRLTALLVRNDLGGALARGPDRLPIYPCVPGGPEQREAAIRFAINILLYATCTDYKSDPAHVETLLQHRRWR